LQLLERWEVQKLPEGKATALADLDQDQGEGGNHVPAVQKEPVLIDLGYPAARGLSQLQAERLEVFFGYLLPIGW
jgi:hypothetical protein